MSRLMCWENTAACIVAMLRSGDMYAEVIECDASAVVIHGYSFEPRNLMRTGRIELECLRDGDKMAHAPRITRPYVTLGHMLAHRCARYVVQTQG